MLKTPVTVQVGVLLGSPFKRTLACRCQVPMKKGSQTVSPTQGNAMARRPHPYFGRLNRREDVRKLEPGQRNACEPLAKPRDEMGILWDAFREEQ